jgi:biotin carboxyl carrier protein
MASPAAMTSRPVLVWETGGDPETAELVELEPAEGAGTTAENRRAILGVSAADNRGGGPIEVVVDGWRFLLEVEDAERAALRARATRARSHGVLAGPAEIRAMIAGRVVGVTVVAGDRVERGDALLVVEAMKMQNQVTAPRAGSIERVAVSAGQTIEQGDLLLILRDADA